MVAPTIRRYLARSSRGGFGWMHAEEPSSMKEQQAQWVVPNPQIPRTFGLMNTIFGSLLLLLAVGFAVYYFVSPSISRYFQVEMRKQQELRKSDRDSKLAELKRREAAAKTEEEKQAVKDERTILERDIEPDLSEMEDLMGWNIFSDLRVAVFYFAEVGAAILLNLLMIISGVGLMALAEWARRLAIGVAWLKIVRWVAMTVVTLVLLVPMTLEKTQKAFKQMETQVQAKSGGRPMPMGTAAIGRMMAIASAAFTVFEAVVASVYPALSIWFLSRPPARAACWKEKPPREPLPSGGAGGVA
jgi:hypothetical protein